MKFVVWTTVQLHQSATVAYEHLHRVVRCASFIARLYVDVLQASSSRRHKNGKKVWITSTLKRLPFLTKLKLVQQIPDHVLSKKNGSRIIKQFSGVYVSTQQIINLTSCNLFIYLRKEKTKGFKLSNEQNSRVGKHLYVRSSSIIKIQTNPCHSCTYYLLPWPQ